MLDAQYRKRNSLGRRRRRRDAAPAHASTRSPTSASPASTRNSATWRNSCRRSARSRRSRNDPRPRRPAPAAFHQRAVRPRHGPRPLPRGADQGRHHVQPRRTRGADRAHPEFNAKFDAEFNAAAALLLAKLFAHLPRRGFFHWDAALTPAAATPLFARAELMAGLRQLAPYRESTLLVTNLRPALIPAEKRSTRAASATTRKPSPSSATSPPPAPPAAPTCSCCFFDCPVGFR